jgi:hypothetical protein
MNELDPAAYTKLKNMRKLLKLMEGQSQVPSEHQARINAQIQSLTKEFEVRSINDLMAQYQTLKHRLDTRAAISDDNTAGISKKRFEQLSAWYLRPLLSHFDSLKKLKALSTKTEGLGGLKTKIDLYLPPEIWSTNIDEIHANLNLQFQFKSMGKGKSQHLETEFYKLFNLTDQNPFPYTTMGKNNLPAFHYNLAKFINGIDQSERSIIVTGLCPMSGISDEIIFVSKHGDHWQPELGFEPLPLPRDDFEVASMVWPQRPILSDYITLKTYVEVLNHFSTGNNHGKVSGLIWYPHQEYIMDFAEVIFSNWLEAEILLKTQLVEELNNIKARYEKLVELAIQEVGYKGQLELRTTQNADITEFETNLSGLDLGYVEKIYGVWSCTESRKRLYLYLILKHILYTLNGANTLHLENSYELWPNVQGSKLVENTEGAGTYSWICHPTTPSLSMSHMRDYNAPHHDKLYLAEPPAKFATSLNNLTNNYILYLAPQILNHEQLQDFNFQHLRDIVQIKLKEINEIFIN